MEDATAMTVKTNQASGSPRTSLFKKLPRTVSTGSVSAKGGAPKRKSTSLPPETVEYLKNWIMSPEHIAHPYPTEQEKAQIMQDTGIELKQLTNWFVNNRKRFWKPRVEARLREQQKAGTETPIRAKPVEHDKVTVNNNNNLSLGDVVVSSLAVASAPATTAPAVAIQPQPPTRVSPTTSPSRHVISAQSSVVSESGSISEGSSEEELAMSSSPPGQTTTEQQPETSISRTETIQIHILRPVSGATRPTIEDVTVLPNIPVERALHSYTDCLLTFRCSPSDTAKKMQRRRDAEIVRLKKSFLKLYLSQSSSSSSLPHVVEPATPAVAVEAVEPEIVPAKTTTTTGQKRTREVSPVNDYYDQDVEDHGPPRHKFRRASIDMWKEACQTAGCVYDHALPSLEEATTLFGFASDRYSPQ